MAFLQATSGAGTTTASATLTCAAHSTLIAFCWVGSNSAPTLHSCSDGSSYSPQIGIPVTDGVNNIWAQIFTLQDVSAGSHTAIFTSDSAATVEIHLIECSAPTSGAIIGTAIGQNQNALGTGADILNSGTITLGGASVTLLGMCSDTSNVNPADEPAVGTGFTSRDAGNDSVIGSWRLESKATSTDGGATFTAIDGASRFLTLGVAIAEPAPAGPSIDTKPVSATVYQGQTANFTIAATTSGGTLHYQWKDDGSNVGTDSNSYTTAAGTISDSGSLITCSVSDDNGTTVSANAVWTVIPTATIAWISA